VYLTYYNNIVRHVSYILYFKCASSTCNLIHRRLNKTKDKHPDREDKINKNSVQLEPSICSQVCLPGRSFTSSEKRFVKLDLPSIFTEVENIYIFIT